MTRATATTSPLAPATVTPRSASFTFTSPETEDARAFPRDRGAVRNDANTEETTACAATTLRIRTLGQFAVSLLTPAGPQTPSWANEQARLLLKCLLAAPTYRLSRDQVIDLLWPHQDAGQGRESLRHALSRLRRTLEPGPRAYGDSSFLASNREEVWLLVERVEDVASPVWIDRVHFERDARSAVEALGRPHAVPDGAGEQRGEYALSLYAGSFLPADLYADWAHTTRTRCQRLWMSLVRALADQAVFHHRFERALFLLSELVAVSPADEDAATRLMRVQAATGHRAEAIQTYDTICAQLDAHLGVPPTRELKELRQAICSCESQQELLQLVLAEPFSQQPRSHAAAPLA